MAPYSGARDRDMRARRPPRGRTCNRSLWPTTRSRTIQRVGLLAVDLTSHGVVMSADSQPVEIGAGINRIDDAAIHRTRDPIVQRCAGGFVGLVGFVGTERIDGSSTGDWLRRFNRQVPDDDLESYCHRLADALTTVWQRDAMTSILEILITGEIGGEPQFWFVRNSQGLDSDGRHLAAGDNFSTQDDLAAYVNSDGRSGEGKIGLLERRSYSFRQGVLLPASPVFDAFGQLLGALVAGGVEGFEPFDTLDDVGQFARVRMEFLKRLCSEKHGIYQEGTPSPIGGEVHVYGVGHDGRICRYSKHRVRSPCSVADGCRAPRIARRRPTSVSIGSKLPRRVGAARTASSRQPSEPDVRDIVAVCS